MMKVLIADALSDKAIEILKSNNLSADTRTGLKGDELQAIIGDYDALIVRSATKATKEIIEKGNKLKVIGRAGIGVDNVDVAAATEKGIVVMNTPQGNALAAAEHSIALMFAAARKIAFADRTMKQGKWEKKALMGIELYEKTLGVIGIGNIGALVAEKALALGMRVIAYDLYVSKEFAESRGIELVDFDTLLKESDFIAIHVPLVKDTRNLINKDAIAKMKKGVIIINVARGPIVNEKDLLEALEGGHVACAALDVFDPEPPPADNPLVLSEKTVCTPHLGASTKEAQDKVAIDIANQIVDFFKNGVIKNSVNAPSVSLEVAKQIKNESFNFKRSVIIAAFGAEEAGLMGSWYFVNRAFKFTDKIGLMINLDMVGKSGGDNMPAIYTVLPGVELSTMLKDIADLPAMVSPKIYANDLFPSDHQNFSSIGIPVALITTGLYRDYHTIKDLPESLDYKSMASITRFVFELTKNAANLAKSLPKTILSAEQKEPEQLSKESVYSSYDVDVAPTFLRGDQRQFLDKWVYDYIKYPKSAVEAGIQGRVIVELIIEKNGEVSSVVVTKSVDDALDAEAVKVVKASPKWKPGMKGGVPVRVKISVPIEFRLKR